VLIEAWFFNKELYSKGLTVAENVNLGLRMKKENPNTTQKKVDEWLDIVGLKRIW
jgi:ABC-type nitrate/sulfonate/bicarbonate transport system, ATPase component